MRIEYIGMFDEVVVPYVEDGRPKEVTFKRGVPVEVPDVLATGVAGEFGGLLEQTDNYRVAGAKKPPAPVDGDA